MAKKNNTNLSNNMIENIKNYSGEIVTISDPVQATRQNAGMYIGSRGTEGHRNMCREIIQNAFDELTKKDSPCNKIIVSYDDRTKMLIVEDNGRGIPFGHIIRIFSDHNTSSNYSHKLGEYSSGLHGVGAKVTNALSIKFIVESYVLGDARRVEFDGGHVWKKGEVKIPNKDNKQGTMIAFIPSLTEDAIRQTELSWKEVHDLIELIIPLTPIGSYVIFNGIDMKGKEYHDKIVNTDGILTYLIKNTTAPIIKPIHLFKDTGKMKMEILFTYDGTESASDAQTGTQGLYTFANCCPTKAGTHIDGFMKGISSYFTQYMNKVFLASNTNTKSKSKKAKLSITASDIKVGLKAIISVAHISPDFNGQSKEVLANDDMDPFVRSTTIELLRDWEKTNPGDLQKLCKYFKDVAELRLKSDQEKVKLTNRYAASTLTGLPSKFIAPTGHENLEFWIVEGDSAGGHMKNNRNNLTQGYFPIRGKMPNAFKTKREKFLSNAEVAGIIAIIGGGYGKTFDISKVKWKYIIFGADADADGDHISALLLRFFLLYMPQLIEDGRVYKATPPLYGYKIRNKRIYFSDRIEYINYMQRLFVKDNVVKDVPTGKEIPTKELGKILYTNIDYTYEIEKISNRYAVDPVLLESVLTLKDLNVKDLKNKLKKIYRFIDVENVNGTISISGVVNERFNTLFLNSKLIKDCAIILDIMSNNSCMVYNVNGQNLSIYQLMNLFNQSTPNSIERYKGLGEMDGEMLYESTMSIDNRTLIRYTLEDAKKEIEDVRYYESNLNKLLTDVKVSRFDVMG